jgi:unsaturated rhamnogalacturonyl hydrolase
MRKFAAPDLPPKEHFHYHQGVFLSGVYQAYLLSGDERYYSYMKDWIDSSFDAEGRILHYHHAELDDIQPGILIFPLWAKTGDIRYRKALESVYRQVGDIPRNPEGGFWHKTNYTDQMWLDGLYMAGPFCAEYGKVFQLPELQELVIQQALLMERKTRDPNTGLLYHACDLSKAKEWANPETGCSAEFWGRSIGWVPVALLDDLDFIDAGVPGREELVRMMKDLLTAVCKYQSDDGRWYQVVNKGGQPGNWLENSCSSLYVAALCKAVRQGYLDAKYAAQAIKGYHGVINSLERDGDDLLVGNVCIGTGVGDYEFYCKRPVSVNDLHGVGAFLLMCAEVQRLMDTGITG